MDGQGYRGGIVSEKRRRRASRGPVWSAMPGKKSKSKQPSSPQVVVDQEALARLAYELYLRRGGEHGHDVEDWLSAERILLKRTARSGPPTRAPKAKREMRRIEDKFRRH